MRGECCKMAGQGKEAIPVGLRMPTLGEVDLSGLSEWEKSSIAEVMEKAKELQKKEDEDKTRQRMEGQLSKWTNLMKGWQYRWFVLNPENGVLEYYVDKGKRSQGSEPRGAVYLMGAVIAPSDEDSVTFSVNATNGDLFKLRASDARQRQQWINQIRIVSEKQSSQLVKKVTAYQPTPGSQTNPINIAAQLPEGGPRKQEEGTNKTAVSVISAEVMEYMEVISELLNTTEAQQMAFLNKLEDYPSQGETIQPLSKETLVTKAVAQTTLHCLYQCLAILQKQIEDIRDAARNSGISDDATIQWFGSTDLKSTVPHSQHPHLLHSHSIPSIPTRSGSIGSKRALQACCQDRADDVDDADINLDDEVDDDQADNHQYSLENENIEEHKSLILHLLSKLKLGMDLTRVPLPTFILEPRSLLEMFADFYGYPELFVKIADQPNPEERILAVVEYYLTSFYAARKGKYCKKPYNPVVGEVFRCSWDISSPQSQAEVSTSEETVNTPRDYKLHYVGEQVSHHPPVSAFYVDCPERNICMNCHVWTKSKFYGMSIGVELIGDGILTLLNHEEEYVFTFPNSYCRSILTHPWTELGGKVNISCSKTGFSSSITFHTKPMYGGLHDHITGEIKHLPSSRVVCKINGEWTDKIELSFPEKPDQKPKILQATLLEKSSKKLRPLDMQNENESRRIWQEVTKAVQEDDINQAAEAKQKIEESQRVEANTRKEAGTEWRTKLFHLHGEKWIYNNHLSLRRKLMNVTTKKRQEKTT